MTDSDLIVQTNNQLSLIQALIKSHVKDLSSYSEDEYSTQSRIIIQHCLNTFLRLNELLTKPLETNKN